jgi:hypothetical protein
MSLRALNRGEKVADRPDEGLIRYVCRLELLNGVARRTDISNGGGASRRNEENRAIHV